MERFGVKMKKLGKLILVLMVMAAMTVGCGTDGEDTSLEDIQSKGKLILGLDDSFPPMGFKDDNQEVVGFDIDVAKEVTKRMGVELVIQPISWDAKEFELSTKNIDCIWNGMSYNEERAKAMTLSTPYMKNTQVAVLLATSDITTLDDLTGKKVVIQNGSTASDAMDANEEFKNSLSELIKVKDNVQALLDLKTSGSDAVVMDEVVARYHVDMEVETYKILDETLADEDYVIGFRKGDVTLCSEVEKYLKEMAADGTLAEISETWFGTDITTIK